MKITVHNEVEEACTFEEMTLHRQYRKVDSDGVVDKGAVYVKYSTGAVGVLSVFRITNGVHTVIRKYEEECRFVPLRNSVTIQFTMPAW
jgi:hypothetical protein